MAEGQSTIIGFTSKVSCESNCAIIKRVHAFDLENYNNYSSSKLSIPKGELSYILGHPISGLLGWMKYNKCVAWPLLPYTLGLIFMKHSLPYDKVLGKNGF